MMLGERTYHLNPTVQVPPCPMYDDLQPTSPYLLGDAAFSALWRFLPSNDVYASDDDQSESAVDAYSCDEFRIYEFKVRRCFLGRPHDWTECPYAHPGEKARRRDPRKYHYSGTACPDFRKGNCMRGDSCEFAHGVFECWLHPARYRTQPCKDGVYCRRRVCFFAHTPEQLRLHPNQSSRASTGNCVGNGDFSRASCRSSAIADSYDGSPLRQQHQYNLPSLVSDGYLLSNTQMSSSPTSTLISPPKSPPSESPPFSPLHGGSSVNELLLSLRQLQLNKAAVAAAKSSIGTGGSWGMPQLISPRGPTYALGGGGVGVVPTSGMRLSPICDGGLFDGWEEPVERVESGRDLRAMMVKKLSKENSLECTDDGDASGSGGVALNVDWISDLVE